MTHFKEISSHPFTTSLKAFRIPKNMVARPIPEYSGGGNPILHVNMYEDSFLGKSDNEKTFGYVISLYPIWYDLFVVL